MNRNFFIQLAFAAHRVADALPQGEQIVKEIRESANEILTGLLLLVDKEVTRPEKKQDLLSQLERQIDILLVYLDRAEKQNWIHPGNFSLLETEYGKIRELLELFDGIPLQRIETPREQELGVKIEGEEREREKQIREEAPKIERKDEKPSFSASAVSEQATEQLMTPPRVESGLPLLSQRQRKIIEFLRAKENAQVWELQKVLPEVTKRTLRRDLDELLQKNLVERKGAWNAVSYELKS
ncbi:MAG: DeoR family transcriptional regulator [Candidatus Wildermuthbacteria bacterium]|nr:DeoR family transcriptional regulator [Candidatus Wildermuthbacteria bacterium]